MFGAVLVNRVCAARDNREELRSRRIQAVISEK